MTGRWLPWALLAAIAALLGWTFAFRPTGEALTLVNVGADPIVVSYAGRTASRTVASGGGIRVPLIHVAAVRLAVERNGRLEETRPISLSAGRDGEVYAVRDGVPRRIERWSSP